MKYYTPFFFTQKNKNEISSYDKEYSNNRGVKHILVNWDYVNLLALYGFPDAKAEIIKSCVHYSMALSDYEPNEAAAILLSYKLSEELRDK
jgi:hypothetical protein